MGISLISLRKMVKCYLVCPKRAEANFVKYHMGFLFFFVLFCCVAKWKIIRNIRAMYNQNNLRDEPIFLTSEVSNRVANQLTQQNTQSNK